MLRIALTLLVLLVGSWSVSAQQVMRTSQTGLLFPTFPERIIPDVQIATSYELWVIDHRSLDDVGFWVIFEYEDRDTVFRGPFETEADAWDQLAQILSGQTRDRLPTNYISVDVIEFLPEYFYVATFDSLEEAQEVAEIFESEDVETKIVVRYGKRRED
ncbi:hypothetical protein [Crateriforma conspicua]|uniref:hypothetical protein n=1 Tax=Crateriforma conspicua TaxID=2527996 RepID=UPI00118A0176|nr:hypothetical protein [Crateriforma conspicua]QDV63063.1 hypothetical protein Mal65_22020 [Crateriforma conspicua]